MNPLNTLYLNCINAASHAGKQDAFQQISKEDAMALAPLAKAQHTCPFLLPFLEHTEAGSFFRQQTRQMMINYFQMEQFTRLCIKLLEKAGIPYVLLKGISLAAYYPQPEYRKLGDVDLYLPCKETVGQACKLLEKEGFVSKKEVSDHHLTYLYPAFNGLTYTLELHFRIVGLYQYAPANEVVDKVFAPESFSPVLQKLEGFTCYVLPPTQYVFYLLHHMLKHYLYSGFGIRLLCDFTYYLTAHYKEIDFAKLHDWCRTSRILHLYEIILTTCRLYLCLPPEADPSVSYESSDCERFLTKILANEDMGSQDPGALVSSGSYQKVNLLTYFQEGHLQMKVRFPKLGRFVPLWPVLWLITFAAFVHNTYKKRNTTLKSTLTSFKKDNENSQLVRIFENQD